MQVTKEEWPEDSYPTYCSGSAFVLSTDVASSMFRISLEVPFFWVDDFYITGLLPLKLGNITHLQFASMYVPDGDLLEVSFTGPQWYTYVFSPVHNLDRIQTVWKTLSMLAKGHIMTTMYSWLLDSR
jgi:Galactosyltransferase